MKNTATILPFTFSDTTVTIELTDTSATALGFDTAVASVTIPKSRLLDVANAADKTGTTLIFR